MTPVYYIKSIFDKPLFLISLPLILSAFTHLWNPIGFPFPDVDEGIYSGRAINFLDTFNPQDRFSGYDHPFFGQIFLAGFFSITGYQNLFSSSENLNYEMILFVPRVFMGILAVIDTLLIFKIGELRYNRNVGFIASILFAVMPITWLTRWIHLDSIQLPLILLSVLFALLCFRRSIIYYSNYKNIFLVLLSGTFLGLSIFTKIPSFTLIPLVGFLIFAQSKKDLKILGLWFMPVLLIPLIWPFYSINVGEFDEWLVGVNSQVHRQSRPLYIAINQLLIDDPFLIIFGFAGLIFAVMKKDLFILLAVAPFLLFMFLINRVVPFHLLFLIAILCISASKLFVDTIYYIKKINKNRSFKLVSTIGVSSILVLGLAYGLASTIMLVVHNGNYQYFEAAAFVDHYLKGQKSIGDVTAGHFNKNITVISQPFFSWMQKYKFDNNNYIPYLMVPAKLMFETEKTISIIDSQFRIELQADGIGTLFKRLFSAFDTNTIATFNSSLPSDNIDVLLTNLEKPNETVSKVTNLLDRDQDWKKSRYINIQKDNGTLNITADTSKSEANNEVNTAFLETSLNLTGKPTFLSIHYITNFDGMQANFIIEVRDNKNNNLLWDTELKNTSNIIEKTLYVLPENVSERQSHFGVGIDTKGKGIYTLTLKKMSLYS